MPRPLTEAELRQEAARVRLEAAKLTVYAEELDRLADAVAKGLPISEEGVIVRHKMQSPAPARPVRQLGRPSKVKHPFRDHLERVGWDVESWAKANNLSPSTVKAWMRGPDDGGRKIPTARASQIEREAGMNERGKPNIPATSATWPSGIK